METLKEKMDNKHLAKWNQGEAIVNVFIVSLDEKAGTAYIKGEYNEDFGNVKVEVLS